MKQLIVLVATVVLGISLSGTVMGMGDGVKTLTGLVSDTITEKFVTGTGDSAKLNFSGFDTTGE